MGDIIDKAQENDELFRRVSLEKHFGKCRAHSPNAPRGSFGERSLQKLCLGCGDLIPVKRLKANPQATRCVECQALVEKRGLDALEDE